MTSDEKKQLKNNLKMFAKAYEYLRGKGLLQVLSLGHHLSWEVFDQLFGNQFKKVETIGLYDYYTITIDGHKFFELKRK